MEQKFMKQKLEWSALNLNRILSLSIGIKNIWYKYCQVKYVIYINYYHNNNFIQLTLLMPLSCLPGTHIYNCIFVVVW
jgi:hypothetical protein